MPLKTSIERRTLQFKKPAGTSRGIYRTHEVWYVRIWKSAFPEVVGIGECAPLPDLSCDFGQDYEERLLAACSELENNDAFDLNSLRSQPSILFGIETALKQLYNESDILWESAFTRSEAGIPINGLVWMGEIEEMESQIREKIELGFKCVKLKIGALDFEKELALLQQIRSRFSPNELILRVDANGAFTGQEALEKLQRLSTLGLHSIEQPIRAGQWVLLSELIKTSPLAIALDEELIGIHHRTDKMNLLERLKPQFIVLKPTLHGGILGCTEWIELANQLDIGWWITSALESNIGLNAIAQWTATLNSPLHQGLGTGMLYLNNIDSPLQIRGEQLWFDLDFKQRKRTFA